MTALLMLGPATPMLFQGQEFGATTPFTFFSEAGDEKLHQAIRKGRLEFLRQFPSAASAEAQKLIPIPYDLKTFERCRLDWNERDDRNPLHVLHRDLIRLRRDDSRFSQQIRGGIDGAVLSSECFALRFFGDENDDRLLLINLGFRLDLNPCSEPLLAPPFDHTWEVLWSSDNPAYGGPGVVQLDTDSGWVIPAEATFAMRPVRRTKPRPKPVDKR